MGRSGSRISTHRTSGQERYTYNLLAKHYTRYLILRLSQYVNDRKIVSQMAMQVLASVTMTMDDLRQLNKFSELADQVTDFVGLDGEADTTTPVPPSRQLIVNEKLRKVAAEINSLEPVMRQAIVFKYIEHLSLDTIVEFIGIPKSYISRLIQQGQTQLKISLAELKEGKNKYLSPVELRRWMDRLEQTLDGQ